MTTDNIKFQLCVKAIKSGKKMLRNSNNDISFIKEGTLHMIVDAVILAAGLSSRTYPDNKLMLSMEGKSIIEMTIESLKDVCDHIVVVTGSRSNDIKNIIGSSPKLEVVFNPDYMKGMFSSIRAGLRSTTGDRIFIIPGDCPMVDASTPKLMLPLEADILIPTFKGQKGHPVLLKRIEADSILFDTLSHSLREYISKRTFTEISVEDPGILWDIDTILEYEQMKSFLNEGGRW